MAASRGDGGAPGPLGAGRELPLRPRGREGCRALALLPLRLPRAGFRRPGRPLSTPPRVGSWVTCARKRAPLGCGCCPPEHLGEFNGVQVCRINSLQGVRCASWRGRVSCRPSGARRGGRSSPARTSAVSAPPGQPSPRAKAPPWLRVLAGGGLALAAVGVQGFV